MSQKNNGRIISCDGENCSAETVLQVGLHPDLGGTNSGDINGPEGWLFSQSAEQWSHYCPECSKLQLTEFLLAHELGGTST